MKELEPSYAGSRALVQGRIDALPAQAEAEIQGLEGQKVDAFNSITAGAQQRGLGFSGIPLGEQAKYTASTFLPAVARVKQSQNEAKTSFLQALNDINLDQTKTAQSLWQQDQDRALQERLAREQAAASERAARAASVGGMPTLGSLGGPSGAGTQAAMTQRQDGGFNFTIGGKSVSAATYANAAGVPFRTLLAKMAQAGDKGAKAALGFVGNDYGYDPRKITSAGAAKLYNDLVWGSGRSASFKAPSGGGGGW